MNEVEIYTDGACKGNPGPGGWGAVLRSGTTEKELFGGEALTTNNRMELLAVIEALTALKRPCRITLHLDSEYVRKGITEWVSGWKARGWRTATKQPVKNVDLWQRLDALVSGSGHAIDWRWVKGHSGNPETSVLTGWRTVVWHRFCEANVISRCGPRCLCVVKASRKSCATATLLG